MLLVWFRELFPDVEKVFLVELRDEEYQAPKIVTGDADVMTVGTDAGVVDSRHRPAVTERSIFLQG